MNNDNFSYRIKEIIKSVPRGKVATYGQIATIAGHPKGARLVSYILHSSSKKDNLPWHRIINRKGMISLKKGYGYEIQYQLLKDEGISFDDYATIDLKKFGWNYEIV
jgi:methylated-DNA-protein-cysteine methyltransferase-like protein